MRHKGTIAAGLVSAAVGVAVLTAPSSEKAPVHGAYNPVVTQSTIHSTICVPGYTKTIRPPVSYTSRLKIKQIKQFHLDGTSKDYEEDHLVPLAVGGAPRDPDNLWPEKWSDARDKDKDERRVQLDVCRGSTTLSKGRAFFKDKWGK